MLNISSKVGLGTAQWGFTYGVSNQSGQTKSSEVTRILKYARDSGINLLDTASVYGEAENILGANDLTGFQVITKLPAINAQASLSYDLDEWLNLSFNQSLGSMGLGNVAGLLVHNCDDLFSDHGEIVARFLHKQKEHSNCLKIGVSVYNSSQLTRV